MTLDEAIRVFANITREQQTVVLASYAHSLTVAARDTYTAGKDGVADPRRLRRINEIQHRVVGQLLHLLVPQITIDDPPGVKITQSC